MQNKLNVFGNATINGTLTALDFNVTNGISAKELKINRIKATHPDSALYIGDSTLVIVGNLSKIYSDEKGSDPRGVAIGRGFIPVNSVLSFGTLANGPGSTAIGYNVRTSYAGSRSIVLGSGIFGSSTYLNNTLPNTLMIGFNSTIPTLFVSSSTGIGTTGNVSIGGNTSPTHKFQVGGGNILVRGTNNFAGITDIAMLNLGDANHFIRTKRGTGVSINTYTGATGQPEALGIFLQEGTANVGIGTALLQNQYNNIQDYFKLSVNGSIRAKEIVVEIGWADFVFEENYKLKPLAEVEQYIKQNGHLPAIPTALEIEKNGGSVGELLKLQMQKIEELTLYIIEQEKRIKLLEQK